MKKEEIKQLSNEDLQQEVKKRKPNLIVISLAIGGMIIMAILNTIASGTGIFTLLPVIFLPIGIKHWTINKQLQDEIKFRGLK